MTDIKATIDRVRELDKAATPGPWANLPTGTPHKGYVAVEEQSARGREDVAHAYCGAYDGHGARNGELIAEYRTAAPRLADEVERLATLLDKTKEANGNLSGEVARAHAVYLDIADSLLPNSSGAGDLIDEIRRLQLREESADHDRDTARAEVARMRPVYDAALAMLAADEREDADPMAGHDVGHAVDASKARRALLKATKAARNAEVPK